MERNRKKILEIREGLVGCPDEFLRRSIYAPHINELSRSLSQAGRGRLWPHVDHSGLIETIRAFHERAGTYTTEVASNISRLLDPSVPLIRFAHTPDFLPYTGVLSNLVLCDAISSASPSQGVPMMLVVDADTVEDTRMRRALLPKSVANLSINVPKRLRQRVVGVLPPPSAREARDVLYWLNSMADVSCTSQGINKLEKHIAHALVNARNFGEFSSIIWSRLINLDAKLGTIFVSQIATAPSFFFAWSHLSGYTNKLVEANFLACKSLEELGFEPDSQIFSRLRFWSVCLECGRRAITKKESIVPCKCGSSRTSMVPTLSSDVLSDWTVWGFSAGTSYLGSTAHVLVSLKIAQFMGFNNWTEILWSGNSVARGELLDGLERSDVEQGRVSIVADLCCESMQQWATAWRRHLLTEGLNVMRGHS